MRDRSKFLPSVCSFGGEEERSRYRVR